MVAGLRAALGPSTVGLNVAETFGSTDGHATGTFAYSNSFAQIPIPGSLDHRSDVGQRFDDAARELPGVPAGQAISGGLAPGHHRDFRDDVARDGDEHHHQRSDDRREWRPATVATAPATGISFTDAAFATPATAFTTAGTNGGTAGIGITSTTSFTITTNLLSVTFGGAPGVGLSNCLETGWTRSSYSGSGADWCADPADSSG